MFARVGLFALSVGVILPLQAQAQSSTAFFVEREASDGRTFPAPAMSLDVLDTDYPLRSLLAAEAGRVLSLSL
jgi:hypothetical protein